MINKVGNDNVSFQRVSLGNISRASKAGRAILEASRDPEMARKIKVLEKHGINFNFVRHFDAEGKRTSKVDLFLLRNPDYIGKDKLIELKGAGINMTSLKQAKVSLAVALVKCTKFCKDIFK